MFGLGKHKEESEIRKGMTVSFFQGRSARLGTVEEIQEDGSVVIRSGDTRLIKDSDEVRPYSSVKGKKARIRFT